VLFLYYLRPELPREKKTDFGIHDAILGVLLGAMMMTNAWDFPIYGLLLIGTYVLKWLQGERTWRRIGHAIWQGLRIAVLAWLVATPMMMNFDNFSKGVGLVLAHSPFYQLLVLWGYQMLIGSLFIVILFVPQWRHGKKEKADAWILSCFFLAIFLIILPEVIYVIDIMGEEYHRANTMFKFTYQAFILFGIAGGYMTVRLWSKQPRRWIGRTAAVICAILIGLACIYPYYAVNDRYGSLLPDNYEGLNGLNYLQNDQSLSDYYTVICWMNNQIEGQPVIVEADGYSFTQNGVVSMATGLPTILGWYQHEWLWHGSPDGSAERSEDVRLFYTAQTKDEVLAVIQKYRVQYVVIGPQEREKFEAINEPLINTLGTNVFTANSVSVLQISEELWH
jgi:uncharacterized membrane protein